MMSDDLVELVRNRIFSDPDLNVYAVLDGASAKGLLGLLAQSGARHYCLMPGNLEPDMMEVSGHVVELSPEANTTNWLLREGWGKHWGVFASSPASLIEVRGHCRMLFRAHDEQGKPLMFRFYDPRVLRVFLPSCNKREQAETFGPVAAWYMEGENPDSMVSLSWEGGEMRRQDILLTKARQAARR